MRPTAEARDPEVEAVFATHAITLGQRDI